MIEAINPTTGKQIGQYEEMTPAAVSRAIEAADAAYRDWRGTDFAHRAALMRKAGAILRDKAREYGRLMAEEMGKPIKDGIAEANKCAGACDYYADHAERFLAHEIVETDARRSFVAFRPMGVILAVMPWNFPFWQVFRFIAPSLMAGNVGLLKHASNVPQCALKIEDIMLRAGFPAGAFQTLLIGSGPVDGILSDPRVAAATLTGSEGAGIQVGVSAAKRIKKVVLELGG
ncbi:MAG: aldehyde dehydrogenase family protein, partial [Stellaceae bacterium]